MSRWASTYEVRKTRVAMRERLKEEREQRMDALVARCSELGYRAEPAIAIRSVPATR